MSEATLPLLVEVGCEEIPARFLADAESQFGDRLLAALNDSRLIPTETGAARRRPAQTLSTARRLVAHVPALLARQPDLIEEVTGPPAKIAFDAEGKPTRAAESFAGKNGVRVEELLQVETPKGLYVAAKKTTPGQPALEALSALLPAAIRAVTFPKSMIWESEGVRFTRPIRWILALLGEGEGAQIVPFEVAGVGSGNLTYRHRLARKRQVAVTGFKDYASSLRRGQVEIDPGKRRKQVRQGIKALLEISTDSAVERTAEGNGAKPHPNGDAGPSGAPIRRHLIDDPALEDWVVASTEWPRPILGSFEPRFLELPREILITVMRDHQKYFALESAGDTPGSGAAESELAPQFVAVLNVPGDPEGIIRRGHERVLTARLEDAKFFWLADQKVSLRERRPMLERVTYHEKLGSYADKIVRMHEIAEYVCAELDRSGRLGSDRRAHALSAVAVCKCDLTTQMVQEFTELQGVVGGLYAKSQGEPEEVWQAIYDHYQPVNLESENPRSAVGAIVALADKLDAVVAGFSVGLEPTGSSDPFGLRRAGNGIVKLVIESLPGLNLYLIASRAWEYAAQVIPNPISAESWPRLEGFLRERLHFYLKDVTGLSHDTIRATLSPETVMDWHTPSAVAARAKGLERVRKTEDFLAIAAAAKRTRNILTKSAKPEDFAGRSVVESGLLHAFEERELYEAYQAACSDLDKFEKGGEPVGVRAELEYAGAFLRLAWLRPAVDRFFDKVMVMDQDLNLRANRLRLLTELDTLAFRRFADLSEIESAP